ncbi:unnamed protein product [Staurois parvus]|jgi:hypothetical protein
MNKLN